MKEERRKELKWPTGPKLSLRAATCPALTAEELKQGYHFCYNSDYLVVGPEHKEWIYCKCPIKRTKEDLK
jgi:hypothetical protein|tara:strand:+ start:1347 stop:1556 length:210 start_codon:yes stop_codon:yes gene_type:complete